MFALCALASAQADKATIDKIIAEGKFRNQVMSHLQYLTRTIGPRLTSSTNMENAYAWTQRKFKEFGCKNVRLEEWGQWPVGFQRGKSSGGMVSPERMRFEFTTPSWTAGTRGNQRGPAIYAPTTMEEFTQVQSKLKGAWVVYKTSPPRGPRPPRPGETPPEQTPEQKAAQELAVAINGAGILGKVTGSRSDLVLTSGNFRDKSFENPTTDISITVRKTDMDKIASNLDAGKPVELEFNLEQRLIPGPVKNYNVIAEIPGTEKPDEVVIISAHLDSWDGPGAQGALDDGTGTSTALEAARILMKAGAKPKRTIRFILWTGEEQGLLGSLAYVAAHKAEMSKISAVLVDDGGTNYQGGYVGLATQKQMFEEAMAPVNAAFPNMPSAFMVVDRMPRGGGSDHVSFNQVGVPGFFTRETGRSDYNFAHHTQYDRYERAIPEYLVQSSTNHAAVAYYLANAPTLVPRDAPPSGGGRGAGK